MIKKLSLLIALFLALASCTKNEFDVEFDLPESVNSSYRVLYYASDSKKGAYIEEAVPITHGKFKLKGITRNPAVVYIFKDFSAPAAAFYVERGDKIKVTGDSPEPASWFFEGNEVSERWSEWRRKNRDALSSGASEGIDKAVEDYVKANSNDILSSILLLNYYDRRNNPAGFSKLWNSLKNNSDPEIIELSPRSDLIGGLTEYTKTIKPMYLSVFGEGADTLDTQSAKASFLYFRRSNDENRDDIIQKIKDLSRQYPDSASRLIAEVSVDLDSISWVQPIRYDSLKNVARAWMPLGFVDEKAMELGVDRTPFFIVAGAKGKRLYSGDDMEKAVSAFRNAAKP